MTKKQKDDLIIGILATIGMLWVAAVAIGMFMFNVHPHN